MHNKIFISANSEPKKFGRKSEIFANFLTQNWLKWNFIMKLAYGDKNLFYNFFSIIIEKFDFPVKLPWEKEVLWIYSFGHVWNIFILPFLSTLVYTLFKKYCVLPRHFRLELLPFRRPVYTVGNHFSEGSRKVLIDDLTG